MTTSGGQPVTVLLSKASHGDRTAEEQLYEVVERELRILAQKHLRQERREHTLQATVLVNDVFIKLIGNSSIDWESRRHFYGSAYAAMRNILIDYSRKRNAKRRGGGNVNHVEIQQDLLPIAVPDTDQIAALQEALDHLREIRPRQADVVELYKLRGHTLVETAGLLDISVSTVKTEWKQARSWLKNFLLDDIV